MSKRLIGSLWLIGSPLGAMQAIDPPKTPVGQVLLEPKAASTGCSRSPSLDKPAAGASKGQKTAEVQAVQGMKQLGVLPADKVLPLEQQKPALQPVAKQLGSCQ